METVLEKKTGRRLPAEALIGAVIAVIFLLSAVLFAAQLRRSAFPEGSSIAGLDCSGLSPAEAAAALRTAADSTVLRITTPEGARIGEVSISSLLVGADWETAARNALRGGSAGYLPDPSALRSALETALCGEGFEPREPEDARLVLDERGAHIDSGDPGNIPQLDPICEAVGAYLAGDSFLSPDAPTELIVADGLKLPAVTSENTALLRSLKNVSRYTDQQLTVSFCGGRSHTFTPEELTSVLTFEQHGGKSHVNVDKTALREMLDRITDELGADGVEAKYGNVYGTRDYVYLVPDDKGFLLDRDRLCTDVAAAITNTHTGTVTAKYDYTWWLWQTYGEKGYCGTAVEISIDNQYLWFYCDGVLLTETPVTTGCIATNDQTNRGFFRAAYIQSDTFLSGPTWYDHVEYWIPFDGNIGLHDSAWRSDYGADWYLESGSHGCINTPLDNARIIFEHAYKGMTFIVR